MKITVVGAGYVGLVTAACLAEIGNDVLCLDADADKLAQLTHGEMPIYEPGLRELVTRNTSAGRLRFGSAIGEGVQFGSVLFIAVGTPAGENGAADIGHVLAVARAIGAQLGDYRVVVIKSTVPVGSADAVRRTIAEALAARGVQAEFDVVSNPEFLKEGTAVHDFMRPERIVVGADGERAAACMRMLYAPFQRQQQRLVMMDVRSAELTKYAANAMLATRISFMNEMALLAEKLGADIEQVRLGIGSDPRIGPQFLQAGCGWGGSCLPKDVSALLASAAAVAEPMHVVAAVQRANERQRQVLAERVIEHFGEDLAGRRFALWGLAFKPETDDLREAPSRVVIRELARRGAGLAVFDPQAMRNSEGALAGTPGLQFAATPLAALDGADALIIVTEWNAFRAPDFDAMRKLMRQPVIFDGRNLYDPQRMRDAGFEYRPIGRGL